MKKILSLALCTVCFANGAQAQEYPSAEQDADSATLYIPYLEYESDDGETRAVSATLTAQKNSPILNFVLDNSSLIDQELDAPALIEGDGACSLTTNAQFRACRSDVSDDYFESMAKCFNYASDAVRENCMDMAVADRIDELEECEDSEEAHANLCAVLGEDPYDPVINPGNFLSVAEIAANPNPYFPLVPGNTWVYEAEDETITVTVLDETREILGVDAIIVQDVVEDEDGELIEDTFDWYGQDSNGDVWYMGELSRNFEDGEFVDIDGSWEAGVDGAKPGIIFRAMPIVGETYRQEYAIGEAEDVGMTQSVEADEFTDSGFDCEETCLEVIETTPLEPDVLEAKYYLPGVGTIVVVNLEDDEREELIMFIQGN